MNVYRVSFSLCVSIILRYLEICFGKCVFEVIQLEHALTPRSYNDRTTLQTLYLRFKVLKFRDPRSLRYTTNLVWNIDKRQANENFKNEKTFQNTTI